MSIRTQRSQVIAFPAIRQSGLAIGDIVRAGANRYPQYKVIAISGERAWIRDVQYGHDHVVPIAGVTKA